MKTCDRCHNPIVGKSFTGKRRDGTPATLCSDCVNELKTKGQPQQSVKGKKIAPSADVDKKRETSKSDSKWYNYMGQGGLFFAFAILVFVQIGRLESGDVYSVRLWWPVVILYRTFGFWGAVTCPGVIAFSLFGWGIKNCLRMLTPIKSTWHDLRARYFFLTEDRSGHGRSLTHYIRCKLM